MLSLTEIVGLVGLAGNILFVGKTYGEMKKEIDMLKSEMVARKADNTELGKKMDQQGERLRSVETNIAGLAVKVDNVKEGVDDLKKALHEYTTALNKI